MLNCSSFRNSSNKDLVYKNVHISEVKMCTEIRANIFLENNWSTCIFCTEISLQVSVRLHLILLVSGIFGLPPHLPWAPTGPQTQQPSSTRGLIKGPDLGCLLCAHRVWAALASEDCSAGPQASLIDFLLRKRWKS